MTRLPSVPVLGILALLLLFLAGCGGSNLPDTVLETTRAIPDQLEKVSKEIKAQEDRYQKFTQSKIHGALAPVAQRENWEGRFTQARTTLDRARQLYDTEVVPRVKADQPESVQDILTQVTRIQKLGESARRDAAFPLKRISQVREALDNPKKSLDQARQHAATLDRDISALEAGAVAAALVEFPHAAETINNRFAQFSDMKRRTGKRIKALEAMAPEIQAGKVVDAGIFTTAVLGLSTDAALFEKKGRAFEASLKELYQSYTKVLQDMKTEFQLTIRRESWDEDSDYDTSRQVSFTRQVTPEVYQALADMEGPIASIVPGFSGMALRNNIGGNWDRLKLGPTVNWPDRYHNAAEFWVEDAKEAYFHKYVIEEDGKTRETDWVQVNPSFYEQHMANLGMAILSKPYGVFEADQLAQAAPPGMANVGNPKYGEWKEDNNGNQFWSWYGRYAFFSNLFFYPPYYYPYGGWYGWHRNYRHKKPYYGTTKNGKRQYGTFGSQVKNSPKYRNSTFAKTGGFKSGPVSVRGAGSRVRGGGPGGKGK